ncbi:RNA 2',3'-cyclic phosphodiesterase [Aquincola sp. S2]|uniref:RNA 2',3'-cyclic phosphodiesterase n=1 Tax=Pseudaquabacterium terrae TaxID=2732868 RepID=A0ABX2END5_9BURK|nr:RNA 2',3'-cyclic phosphodiesterase [Aquabacterium terrae]NRF70079.1 RNA 2',3'-cyclic phosphodiesterase [Aquabacterium terrae]
MDRLFFAAHPDAAAAQRIDALTQSLRRELGLKGKPIPTERCHLTLLFVGTFAELPAGLAQQLAEAANHISCAPFELRFDRIASFDRRPANRPLVLLADAEPVAPLHDTLVARLRAAGLPFEAHRAYTPHLTLMYDDQRVPARPVEPIGWTVREFVLMHSLVGRSTHVPLARWPLAA